MDTNFLGLLVNAVREMPLVAISLAAIAVAGLSVFAIYKISYAALRRGNEND